MKNIYHGSGRKSQRKRCRAVGFFTLIEILVVVGIMMLLMSIMLPAFDSMATSSGLRTAIREVSQTLKLARIYAINNREYVAMVMPIIDKEGTAFPAQTASGIPDKYNNRVYRVCVVDENDNFKHWIPGEKWKTLPLGIIFVSEAIPDNAKVGLMQSCLSIAKVDYSDLGGDKTDEYTNTAGIRFTPSGHRDGNHPRYFVLLGEGVFEGGKIQFTNLSSPAAATSTSVGSKTWLGISINKFGHVNYIGSPYGANDSDDDSEDE